MKMTNANRAVLFSIIGLCVISIVYRLIPREIIQRKTILHVDLCFDETPALQTLIAQFEEQNPDIVVVPVHHSYQDLAKKLFEAPVNISEQLIDDAQTDDEHVQSDLVLLDMDWLPNLFKNHILEPLSGFPADNPDLTRLYEMSKLGGVSYAVPLFSSPYIFFYNIDVLQSTGFDRPPKTRDDFLRYCRALKEKQTAGIGLALSDDNHAGMQSDVFSWFWNSGIAFISEDNKPQFSARQARETFAFLDTLSKENLVSPGSFSKSEEMKIDEFCAGNTAMMIASFSALPEIAAHAAFEWGISTVPTAASYIGNPLFVTETFGMGMYAASGHKEEAWKFLSFLAGAEHIADLASSYYCIPENQNAVLSFAENPPQMEKALELFNTGKEINEFDVRPGVFVIQNIIRDELQKMMTGEISPERAAEAIQEKYGMHPEVSIK